MLTNVLERLTMFAYKKGMFWRAVRDNVSVWREKKEKEKSCNDSSLVAIAAAATEVSWELSRVDVILLFYVFIVSFLYL
jgi:hypothetical protein